jgi:hypothetical protein
MAEENVFTGGKSQEKGDRTVFTGAQEGRMMNMGGFK